MTTITLNLNPFFSDTSREITVNGSVVIVDGNEFDLSDAPINVQINHPELGILLRTSDTEYSLTMRFPHSYNAPAESRFPEPITLIDHTGPVDLPPFEEEKTDELD